VSRERQRRSPWEWGIAVLLLFVAFWFRTYRLTDVPPGLHHDDIKNVILVKQIMTGDLRVYYSENYGHEPLYHWLQALWFALLGTGYPEVRLLSVGISMAGLALIYALVRRLLGRRVALWTLAWQAVSLWPLFYSRRAIRGILLPPLAALTGYLFLGGLEASKGNRRWGTWAGAGVALSACLYTYMGSRVLPVLFLLYAGYLALLDRSRLRACWPGIVAFFAVCLVLTLPLGAYLVTHTEERMDQINLPLRAIRDGDWRPLLENSLRALGMFSFVGDPHWRQFVADTPAFEPLGAVLFYGGLLLSLWRWRRFKYAFSVLWLPLALAPAMLSEGAPNFLRPIAAVTVVHVFPALAVDEIVGWVQGRMGRAWAWGAVVLGVVLLGANAWRTIDGYFVRWPQHPDARFAYNATLLDESRYVDGAADVDALVLSGHFPSDLDPALVDSFMRRTDLVPRWCDLRQALIYPGGEGAYVFQPDYFPIDPVLHDLFVGADGPLFEHRMADGTFVFAVYRLEDSLLQARLSQGAPSVGWSHATVFPDGLPDDWASLSWPVVFAERVGLVGYEILNGERFAPGDVVTVLTYWHVLQPGPAMGITFLHLLGPDGAVVAGYDGFGAPPNHWVAGDVLVQVHRFGLPGDLAPGRYPVELGWYERDALARWNVPTAGGGHAPADRVLLQPLVVE
jgi:4-amino-4-deoxy-L-arabinose transferase-like glycosyltransferase